MKVPLCNSLEDFAGIVHETSEQYKKLQSSLQTKDNENVDCFIKWGTSHLSCESRPADMLVSLLTVVIANEFVNCDNAISVGINPQENLIGTTFAAQCETAPQKRTSLIPRLYGWLHEDSKARDGHLPTADVKLHPFNLGLNQKLSSIHEVWACAPFIIFLRRHVDEMVHKGCTSITSVATCTIGAY